MTSTALPLKGYLSICRVTNLPSVWTNVLCACVLATGRFTWAGFLIPALSLSCLYLAGMCLNVLCACLLSSGRFLWADFLLPAASLSCLYLAGMCLNDICDRDYDKVHRPSRPIPSEAVPLSAALFVTCFLMGGGSALLLLAEHREGLLAAMALVALIVWYDLRHKGNPYSVLLMAACRFLVFVVTSLSLIGRIPAAVLLAATASFAYVVVLSLVARYENSRSAPFALPVIPLMLSGICLLDGVILALLVGPAWLVAGLGAALLMQSAQRYVRGD